MNKKLLSVLLTVCVLLSAFAAALPVGAEGEAATVPEGYTAISDADGLVALMGSTDTTVLAGKYYLTTDISLAGKTQAPIGTNAAPFTGIFNGGNHTISDISISGTTDRTGFFGAAKGATIENLTLEGAVSSSLNSLGGFVGNATMPLTIRNCTNRVTVTNNTKAGKGYIGGFVGLLTSVASSNATFENLVNEAAITSPGATNSGKYSGGIVGSIGSDTASFTVTFTNCVNKGTVSSANGNCTGGMIGYYSAATSKTGATLTMTLCKNEADITGITYVGGLVGALGNAQNGTKTVCTFTECANYGDITATTASSGIAAGLFGIFKPINNTSVVERCTNFGAVKGDSKSGGLIGAGTSSNTGVLIHNFNGGTVAVYTAGAAGAENHPLTGSLKANAANADRNYYVGAADAGETHGVAVAAENVAEAASYAGFNADEWVFTNKGPEIKEFHNHEMEDGICATCGYNENCTHTSQSEVVTLEPTCSTKGSKNFVCDSCGLVISSEEIDLDPDNHEGTSVSAVYNEENGSIDFVADCCGGVIFEDYDYQLTDVYVASTGSAVTIATDFENAFVGGEDAPFANFADAMKYAAASASLNGEATINIVDTASTGSNYATPEFDGTVTITGGKLTVGNRFFMNGNITIENIEIATTAGSVWPAQTHTLTLGEGIVCSTAATYDIYILGGYQTTVPAGYTGKNGNIIVRSGIWERVVGANRQVSAATSGEVNLVIGKTNENDTLKIERFIPFDTNCGNISGDSVANVIFDGPVEIDLFYPAILTTSNTVGLGYKYITNIVLEQDADITDDTVFHFADQKEGSSTIYVEHLDGVINVYADARSDAAKADAAKFQNFGATTVNQYGYDTYCKDVLDRHADGEDADTLCDNCGIDTACTHTNVNDEIFEDATCTEEGTMNHTCADCGATLPSTVIDINPSNHTEGLAIAAGEGSVTYTRTCCGAVEYTDTTLGTTVYVSENGIDLANKATTVTADIGLTEATAFKSFDDALVYAAAAATKNGEVTVTVLDNAVIAPAADGTVCYYDLPETTGKITITGGTLNVNTTKTTYIRLNSDVTFENIVLTSATAARKVEIYGQNHKLVMGEGVTMGNSVDIYIFGGFYSVEGEMHTDITIRSGDYYFIAGWGRTAATTVNYGTGMITIGTLNETDTITIEILAGYASGAQTLSADSNITFVFEGVSNKTTIGQFKYVTNNKPTVDMMKYAFDTTVVIKSGYTFTTMYGYKPTEINTTLYVYVDERSEDAIATSLYFTDEYLAEGETSQINKAITTNGTNVVCNNYYVYCANNFKHPGAEEDDICDNCGANLACAHEASHEVIVPSTCVVAGTKTVVCDTCGKEVSTEALPLDATNHEANTNGVWAKDEETGKYYVACSACSGHAVEADEAYVYVQKATTNGDDTNTGLTLGSPVKTLTEAVNRIKNVGGKVIVNGYYLDDHEDLPDWGDNTITFTSDPSTFDTYGAATKGFLIQKMDVKLSLGGAAKFDAILFKGTSKNGVNGGTANVYRVIISANWHNLDMGYIRVQTYATTFVLAGTYGSTVDNAEEKNVTLNIDAPALSTGHQGFFYERVYLGDAHGADGIDISNKTVTLNFRDGYTNTQQQAADNRTLAGNIYTLYTMSTSSGRPYSKASDCTSIVNLYGNTSVGTLRSGDANVKTDAAEGKEPSEAYLEYLELNFYDNSIIAHIQELDDDAATTTQATAQLRNVETTKIYFSTGADGRTVPSPHTIFLYKHGTFIEAPATVNATYGTHSFVKEATSGVKNAQAARPYTIIENVIPECTWGEGVVTKEPTLEANGVMTYTCTECGRTKTEEILFQCVDHTPVAKADGTYYCSNCKVVVATPAAPVIVAAAPATISDGKAIVPVTITSTTPFVGVKFNITAPAGFTLVNAESTLAAVENAEGFGIVPSDLPADPFVVVIINIAAQDALLNETVLTLEYTVAETITEGAHVIKVVAEECYTIDETTVEAIAVSAEAAVATAHVHTEVTLEAVAPTCTTTGLTEGKKCSVCDEILVEQTVVEALGHSEETLEAVAPTYTTTGLTEGKKCSVCDEILVEQQVIPMLVIGGGEFDTFEEVIENAEEGSAIELNPVETNDATITDVIEKIGATDKDVSVTIPTLVGTVTFDKTAVAAIAAAATGDVEVVLTIVNTPETVANSYDITLVAGETTISDFGGEALVTVAYSDINVPSVFYVNGETKEAMEVMGYENGFVTFVAPHFSTYVVEETAHTHSWDEGEITTHATRDADAIMTFTCEGCGETRTETVATVEDIAASTVKKSVVFESAYILKFRIPVENVTANVSDHWAVITSYGQDGEVVTVVDTTTTAEDVAAGNTRYDFPSPGIPAKCINDKIVCEYYQIIDGVKHKTPAVEYNLVTYAKNQLAKDPSTVDTSWRNLLIEMLNYSTAAQIHFSYNTEGTPTNENPNAGLANLHLTGSDVEKRKSTVADYQNIVEYDPDIARSEAGDLEGMVYDWGTQAGDFESEVTLIMNYPVLANAPVANALTREYLDTLEYRGTYTDAFGNEQTAVIPGTEFVIQAENNRIRVYLNCIAAKDLRSEVTGAIYVAGTDTRVSETCTTGFEIYAVGRIAKGSATMQALAYATLHYSDAAFEYFKNR